MLAKYYRFRVVNNTDQTLTYDQAARIELRFIPWKFASGAMAYGAEITDLTAFLNSGESIVAAAESEGTIFDNSTLLHMGLKGTLKVIADVSSTDGTIDLYMEESTDDSVWPSDMADFDITLDMYLIGKLTLSTDAVDESRAINFQF